MLHPVLHAGAQATEKEADMNKVTPRGGDS